MYNAALYMYNQVYLIFILFNLIKFSGKSSQYALPRPGKI